MSIGLRERPAFKNERPIAEFFGENALTERKLKERLSPEIFNSLHATIHKGVELDPKIAPLVAEAMRQWAVERGATHFCHWFQPLTDLTAERHDTLFSVAVDGNVIVGFDENALIRGESDASSFPSGGLRTTFEARGYTAWDPSSPAFVMNNTLMIPTMFVSWKGDALDKKTPLLRSMEALNKQALRVLRLFGDEKSQRVVPTLAGEQEYFLIDKLFSRRRPDILLTGRTLFGAKPPKGQELEDQYFGVIPPRVINMMEEAEYELLRLGIPVQTRHNEVAPSQYELALLYQSANLSSDHHMLVMQILCRTADKHGLTCLLHEKPFAGINGSGKHSNWSLATDLGKNLLEPGDSPAENAQFLLFCAATLRAVHRYAPLLRTAIASASNDHRLGMHEAPPGIISVFLGDQLFDIFRQLLEGKPKSGSSQQELIIGLSLLPKIPRHSGDRNRTSPFAFTGNKFEFRAVGAMANLATPNTVLNTVVAESLDYFATQLEQSKRKFHEALHDVLVQSTKEFFPVLFEGDNYSEEWHAEAERRRLPNVKNTVDATQTYKGKEARELFTKYRVYSERELDSRFEIALEKYISHVLIEAKTASQIAHTMIIPAVLRYVERMGAAVV
ncbi:MAG: glutamine synthetase III, partial [Chlamydiales bacterium]